jgi:hypothetical protein
MEFQIDHPEYQLSFTLMRSFLQAGTRRPPWMRPELEVDHPGLTAPTLLAQRSVFATAGKYNEDYSYGETADWLARAKEQGINYGVLDQPLYLRRVHESNLSHALDTERTAIFRALKHSLDRKRTGRLG